jgi:hypothetical protein
VSNRNKSIDGFQLEPKIKRLLYGGAALITMYDVSSLNGTNGVTATEFIGISEASISLPSLTSSSGAVIDVPPTNNNNSRSIIDVVESTTFVNEVSSVRSSSSSSSSSNRSSSIRGGSSSTPLTTASLMMMTKPTLTPSIASSFNLNIQRPATASSLYQSSSLYPTSPSTMLASPAMIALHSIGAALANEDTLTSRSAHIHSFLDVRSSTLSAANPSIGTAATSMSPSTSVDIPMMYLGSVACEKHTRSTLSTFHVGNTLSIPTAHKVVNLLLRVDHNE